MMMNLLQGNRHHDDVVDYVQTHDPDLFIAIEADHAWTEGLKPIHSMFPHRYVIDDRGTSSIAAYSRIPFDSIDVHYSTKRKLPSLDMHVTIDQQPIRIFATHPYIPLTREKASMRNEQLDEVESLLSEAGPRILLGDFNCAPWSPHFVDVLRNTRLTPAGYGTGLRPTWYRRARAYGPLRQTWIFALKLDHMLLSDDLAVVDYWIGPCLGSDHRPVVVDFATSQNASQTTAASR
jgi:endonuclease/exonuclease/phosphatase (EEP) superfamily protein YafD